MKRKKCIYSPVQVSQDSIQLNYYLSMNKLSQNSIFCQKKNLIIIFFPLRFNDRFHKTITSQIKTLTRTLTKLLINFKIQSFRVGLQQTEFVLSIYFLYFTCQTTIFSGVFLFNGCSVLNLRSSSVCCGCFSYAFVNIVIFGFDGLFCFISHLYLFQ